MGRLEFVEYAEGMDIAAAFAAAVAEAQYEYGHGGYTGTIAEKDAFGYVALTDELMTLAEATALAKKLLNERDKRCDDSDMPACGIPVRGGERTHTDLPVPVVAEGYPSREAAAAAALGDQLAAGENIVSTSLSYYNIARNGRVIAEPRCRVSVITTGSPTQTGWLFFGNAMY
jgi:hypothetical protein